MQIAAATYAWQTELVQMVEAKEQCAEVKMVFLIGHVLLAANVFHSIDLATVNVDEVQMLFPCLKFKLSRKSM